MSGFTRRPFRYRPVAAGMLLSIVCLVGADISPVRALSADGVPRAGHAVSPVAAFVEPQDGEGPVLSLIRGARHSIRLEVYELTDRNIIAALASAKHRHVSIEVILEQHPFGGGQYAQEAFNNLHAAGISVRWANESAFTYTHEKAMDVDGRVAGIFTLNLSYSAFSSNREFGVIDRSTRDANQIGSVFAADWNRRGVKLTDDRLVVSPINARSAISHLIRSARRTLDLYEEEMDDPSIESDLKSAVRRHVRVRLITSDESSGVGAVKSAGIRVVLMSNPYVHAKAIIADSTRLFVGSENISATSLDQNREMGIIVQDRHVAGVVERNFLGDWSANGGNRRPTSGGRLTLSLTAHPHAVTRGELVTITAATLPSATCTITVTYPDGYVSRARELQGQRLADSSGLVSWSWHVGSTVTGTAHAAATCRTGGNSATKTVGFVIRASPGARSASPTRT